MKNSEKGFTLVEIILVMAIASLLLIPIFSLLISNSKSVIHTTEKADVQEKATNIMLSFQNNCMYTKSIKSCIVDGYNYMYQNTIPDNSNFTLTLLQPTSSGIDKEIKYEYNAENKELHLNDSLLAKNVSIDVIPLFQKSTPPSNRNFSSAIGLMLNVTILKSNTAINKTSEIKKLTNTFYFRNAGLDFSDVLLEDAAGSAAPTPFPVPTISPNSGNTSSGSSSGSGTSGGSSGSGSGGSSDTGDTGDGGSSSGSGDSSSSGGSSTSTSTPSPTIAPSASPTTVPTIAPSASPTATPTPTIAPTTGEYTISFMYDTIVVNEYYSYGEISYEIYNSTGNVHTSEQKSDYINICSNTFNESQSLDIYIIVDDDSSFPDGQVCTLTLPNWPAWPENAEVRIHNESSITVNITNQAYAWYNNEVGYTQPTVTVIDNSGSHKVSLNATYTSTN